MMQIVNMQGVIAKVQKFKFNSAAIALTAVIAIVGFTAGCSSTPGPGPVGGGDPTPTGTAATVNGTAIKMEDVERVIKAQGQGQETKLSPLELAQARLQVLDNLIQQEVMFQRAQKENVVPTDDDVTVELNKRKTESGMSQEEFDKRMKDAGETEATLRDSIKKALAIQRLNDKITGKIEPPKDGEIQSFFNGNKEQFKAKRGAQLAVIVIDPQKVSETDTTTNQIEAQQKAKEVGQQLLQGADFATVAREKSEDPQTALKGGDWRYFTEEEMKQTFGAGVADYVMNKMQNGNLIPQAIPLEGRILIIKLQRKQDRDEDQTLETPGIRQQITDFLVNARKQLLIQSYMAIAMDESKIDNLLTKQIVENPNNLSGARPVSTDSNTNTNTAANSNTNVNANSNAAVNTNAKANTNTNAGAKPAANVANTNAGAR